MSYQEQLDSLLSIRCNLTGYSLIVANEVIEFLKIKINDK